MRKIAPYGHTFDHLMDKGVASPNTFIVKFWTMLRLADVMYEKLYYFDISLFL